MGLEFSKYDLERRITIPRKSEKLAELFGILAGDGYVIDAGRIHKFGITLNLSEDVIYARYVIRLIKELFNLEPTVLARREFGGLDLVVSSKAISGFVLSIGFPNRTKKGKLHVPKWITKDKALARAFLRGLFDTDGSFFLAKRGTYKSNEYPVIEIKSHDDAFLAEIYTLVKSIGFGCVIQKDRIQLNGRPLALRWFESIRSNNLNQVSRYIVWRRFRPCPPGTTLMERLNILRENDKANKASDVNLV